MKKWTTELTAIYPKTGELCTWVGDIIEAPTKELAEQWCEDNEKGYLKVIGELVSIIDCFEGTTIPDWSTEVNYQNIELN